MTVVNVPHAIVRRTTNFVTSSITPVILDTLASSNFVAGRKYLIMAQYQWSGDNAIQEYKFQLTHGATPTIFPGSQGAVEVPNTVTRLTYSFFTVYTAVAGEDVDIRVFIDEDTPATMTVRLGSLVAIDLSQFSEGTDWHFNENIASTSLPNSPTFTTTNNALITFTPPIASQDWLILAEATIAPADNTVQFNSRLRRTGEATENFPLYSQEGEDALFEDLLPHFMARTVTLGAVSNTFETDSNKESGASASTRESSHVFAINLDRFTKHSQSFIQTGITLNDEFNFTDSTRVATTTLTPQETFTDVLVLGAFSKSRNENSGLSSIIARMQVNNIDRPATQTSKSYDQLDGWDAGDKLAWRLADILVTPGQSSQRLDIDCASNETIITIGDRMALLLELGVEPPHAEASVDALLLKEQTETITNDAILVNVETETILVDARLAVRREVLLDALLRAQQAETVLVDSILVNRNTATITTDAIVVNRNTETISVDAMLKLRQTETVLADSILVNRNAETITADSILVNQNTETVTVDALIRKQQTNNVSVDALLRLTQQNNVTVDSILVGTKLQILVDAILGMVVPIMVDAQLTKEQTETITVDALIRKQQTTDITVDAQLVMKQTEAILVDSILKAIQTNNVTNDSILVNRNTVTATLDALLLATQTNDVTIDSHLEQAQAETIQVDANIGQTTTANIIADAIFKRIVNAQSSVDARLDVVTQTSITVDAFKQFPFLEIRTVDAILAAGVPAPLAISVDGIIDQAGIADIIIDVLLRGQNIATANVDATIETPSIQIVSSLDSILVNRFSATSLIDSKLVSIQIEAILLDSILINRKTNDVSVDSNIELSPLVNVLVDATIELLKSSISTIDSILVNRNTAQAVTDAKLLFENTAQVSVDADLRARIPLGVSVDSNIRLLNIQESILVDSLLALGPSQFLMVDARLLATPTQDISIDALLIRSKQITLDANIGVGQVGKPILIDGVLSIPRIVRTISEIRDNIKSTSIIRRRSRLF